MARELTLLTGLIVCLSALIAIVLGQVVMASASALVGILLVATSRYLS